MNVEIGAEAALFPEKEYIKGIFVAVYVLDPTLIKKENQIFLIYKEIQSGAVAKSYIGKDFLIYEAMRKYFPI